MLGDGSTHGIPVASKYIPRRQPSIGTTSRSRRCRSVSLNEPGELADRHAVPHRQRIHADERLEPVDEHRPFDGVAADRVRAVADDRPVDAVLPRGLQAVRHRVDVGVDARADVLQVDRRGGRRRGACPRSARGFRCRASTPARGGARRARARSRSCFPARRTGSRAAGRKWRSAASSPGPTPRPGGRRRGAVRCRPTPGCTRCPRGGRPADRKRGGGRFREQTGMARL